MATLEQERASFALRKVEAVAADDNCPKAKFKTQLLKLPARLHSNGLGPTAAYYLAQKSNSPERAIYLWLQDWLRPADGRLYPATEGLIQCITGVAASLPDQEVETRYRSASAEARALAVWLKRFAEAFLEEDGE